LTVINDIRTLLLAAWLGVAIYFSAVVAPSTFAVLRSFSLPNAGEIAGTIVTRTLSVVNLSGFVISLFLLFTLKRSYRRPVLILETLLVAIISIATGVGHWVIAARMRGLRAAMHGQIDQVALSDPYRVAFAALHGYSVAALGIAMLAAIAVILLMVLSRENQSPIATK
jgi:hypothetical protein